MEKVLLYPDLKFRYAIYDNSTVFNLDNGRQIKPYNDPRRPNEVPIIYLQKKDGKRFMMYHDQLMCESFFDFYKDSNLPIIHLNGDVNDCRLENLYVADGISVLKNIYHETKEWRLVHIEEPLYYTYYICEDGRLYNGTTDSFVKPYGDNRKNKSYEGYLRFSLYRSKSVSDIMHYSAARLVALHFIPKPEGKDNVIYRDNNYSNIDRSNLYWGDNYDTVMKRYETDRNFISLHSPIFGDEKWKDMEYFDEELVDNYKVSNFGRIYNETKGFFVTQINGCSNNLNQSYKIVNINTKKYGFKNISVHRLVAYNFIKNNDWKTNTCVNHINGNPEFNYAFNLEWYTPFYNLHHAIQTNLFHYDKYFADKGDNDSWRLIAFFAWSFGTIKDLTIESCYNFYTLYIQKFNDINSELSFNDFKSEFEKAQLNMDYIKLLKFYEENY